MINVFPIQQYEARICTLSPGTLSHDACPASVYITPVVTGCSPSVSHQSVPPQRMQCRLLLYHVTHALCVVPLLLKLTCSAPITWSSVSNLNVTGNLSLPDFLEDMSREVNFTHHLHLDGQEVSEPEEVEEEQYGDSYEDEYEDDYEEEYEEELKALRKPPAGLGLSGHGPGVDGGVGVRDLKKEPPDYMMDLYKRFSQTGPVNVHPTSSIVRSFMNVNMDDLQYNTTEEGEAAGNHTRIHKLVFNITSISRDEEIDYAMLRLYTLVQQDRDAYAGVNRIVSVLQDRGKELAPEARYETLSSRHIYEHNSGWEAFDVTSAVRRWSENISCVQILEVRIESVFNVATRDDMDIDTDPTHRNEPLLIIFSNNVAERRLRETERQEVLSHELDILSDRGSDQTELADKDLFLENSNATELSRVKRSRKKRNSCRRQKLYVDFKDINWQMWIVVPSGYEAFECVGKCYFPLSDHLTPTKHAIIQTLLHMSKPKERPRACCVPTKLDPISILYLDENKVMTYKYKFHGMKVAECGCR